MEIEQYQEIQGVETGVNGMQKARLKLRSRAGESIGETLIAMLVSALALLMLAGAVSSAANIVKKSNEAMSEVYSKTEGEDTEWLNGIKDAIN